MSLLSIIWWSSDILCGGAIAWMLILIALRLVSNRRARRRAQDRKSVHDAMVSVLQGRADPRESLAPYRGRARLMAEALLEFLGIVRGADLKVMVEALRALGVDQVMRRRVGQGSLAGRLACVEALGAFPGPKTQFTLVEATTRGPAQLRLAALRSLRQAGGEVSLGRLLDDLAAGHLEVSGPFADLLSDLVADAPGKAAKALARENLAPPARIMLLEALGACGAYDAIPFLDVHLSASQARVRAAAIKALGHLRHPAALSALRTALEDPDWSVRSAAAEAAETAALPGLLDSLTTGLQDGVWRVRHQCAAALVSLGAPGLERLHAAVAAENELAAPAAALTLAERGLAA